MARLQTSHSRLPSPLNTAVLSVPKHTDVTGRLIMGVLRMGVGRGTLIHDREFEDRVCQRILFRTGSPFLVSDSTYHTGISSTASSRTVFAKK